MKFAVILSAVTAYDSLAVVIQPLFLLIIPRFVRYGNTSVIHEPYKFSLLCFNAFLLFSTQSGGIISV